MCEGPEEAGQRGFRLGRQQQAVPEQQEERGPKLGGPPAPEGTHHSPPGLKALQETRSAHNGNHPSLPLKRATEPNEDLCAYNV